MTDQKPMMLDGRQLLEWLDADSHLHSGEYDAIRRRQFRQAIEEAHKERPRIARDEADELRSILRHPATRQAGLAELQARHNEAVRIADAYGEPE